MNWILLTLTSAVLLGGYDFFKKRAVHDNAVPVVLLFSVITAASLWLPVVLVSYLRGPQSLPSLLSVEPLAAVQHLQVATKAVLVGASWTLAFLALKQLPLSIAGPIRSTSPMWTILIAVGWLGERPSAGQWAGIALILISFYLFSRAGSREGIHFHRNRWVFCMVGATLLGAVSSIYDKYLLQTAGFNVPALQAWFSIYLVPVMMPLAGYWFLRRRRDQPFYWRWSIPLIAVSLLAADFAYFTALDQPGALVSLISPLRRTSVVIPFLLGILLLGEKNFRVKAIGVAGLVAGVFLVALSDP